MLGLSQGVSSSAGIFERLPVVSYLSDFSSTTDGFTAYDSRTDSVDLGVSLTPNIDFEGKTDVLKIAWSNNDADGLFFIRRSFPDLDDQDGEAIAVTFSADIYYDEFTVTGDIATLAGAGAPITSANNIFLDEVAQDEWVTISGSKTLSASTFDQYLYIGIADSFQKPKSGDEMYITNISFTFQDIG